PTIRGSKNIPITTSINRNVTLSISVKISRRKTTLPERRIIPELNHFEIARCQSRESWIENSVIPPCVIRSCDVHIRAVIGHYQTVSLHRPEYLPGVWIIIPLVNIDTGLKPQASAHRQGSGCGTGTMRCRINITV